MAELPLTRGCVAIVDDDDVPVLRLHKWRVSFVKGLAYAITTTGTRGNQRTFSMHRFLMDAEKGETIDHRDGDGLNNRRSNLRICTQQQNLANMRPRVGSPNGYKGVSCDDRRDAWYARIGGIYIGAYDDAEAAARAYDAKAREIHGEFARTNFPVVGPAPTRRITRSRTGYRGVSFDPRINKYVAKAGRRGKIRERGYFIDPKDAALAYDDMARELYGGKAKLNFPA